MTATTVSGTGRPWLARAKAGRPQLTVMAIGGVLLVGLAVAAGLVIASERTHEMSNGERGLAQLSLALVESSARTIQGMDLILIGLEEHVRPKTIVTPDQASAELGTENVHRLLIERIRDTPQIEVLGIVNADGRVVNTSRSWPASNNDVTSRDYFAAHRANAGLGALIGEPVTSSTTGQRTMFLTRRLNGPDGLFLGVLAASIQAHYFEDFFRAVLPAPEASIFLFRKDGKPLAQTSNLDEAMSSAIARAAVDTVARTNAGTVRIPSSAPDDATLRMAVHSAPNYGLIVSIANTEDAILADWRRNTKLIVLASLAVVSLIALSLVLVVRVARSEAQQEETLRSEAHIRDLNATLTASLTRLQAISDNVPAMVMYSDADRIIRFINKTGAAWLGRPAHDIVGKTFAEIMGRPARVGTDTLHERLKDGPYYSERVQQHPDGKARVLNAVDVGDFGPDGTFLGYYSLRVDITERRESEKQVKELHDTLRANIRQLKSITDNIPVLIAYIDRDRRIRFINKTGELWYARPAADIIGHTAREIVGRGPTMNSETLFDRLAEGPMQYETLSPMPDGQTRRLSMLRVPDLDADGEMRGYYVLMTDITQQRSIEDQLRQAQKLEAIGKLTGGVAHDFNNLLAVIVGNLDLALEDAEAGIDSRSKLQAAIRACQRASGLTQSLLAFSRQQSLNPKVLDLSALVTETTELIRRTAPANISIQLLSEIGLWHCEADSAQLENALLNLVVNACDAMPNGGRLTIETKNARLGREYAQANPEVVAGDYVMLAVSDTGGGMPPEVAARAFEPFFTTKGVGKGTGLGLSMVYGFVKQSGGHAKIYSEVGNGTVVKIYLPRRDVPGSAMAEERSAASDATRIPVAHGETVLVVEDNPAVRELVCNQLRSLGYAVLEAGDAEEALALLHESTDIDLLLADVVLPGEMSGPQLAEQARAMRPGLRVLHMSGYTANAMLHNGRMTPGTHLLQKPFARRELANKLREVLDQTPGA